MEPDYLSSVTKQFEYYKLLGEQTIDQVENATLFFQPNGESNSIATIVKHLSGNMLSRWTDFLNSDGEKAWRNRDAEFEQDLTTRQSVMECWHKGWNVFLETLRSLKADDLQKIIYIRNQGHTVLEAINRQLAHYPYHIGQIVYIGKMQSKNWKSLSIPRGGSGQFNAEKFAAPKTKKHFTDEVLQTAHRDRARLKEELINVHRDLVQICRSAKTEALHLSENGKWSALQHLQHINKSTGAFYKYLKMNKDELRERFGSGSGSSRSQTDITSLLQSKLEKGLVAPPQFSAAETTSIVAEDESSKCEHITKGMVNALENWSDQDLDQILCPHPALGMLTAREMVYFTILHVKHHSKSILRLIG